MKLIRYAGYDPGEDDFSHVELAPLHDTDVNAKRSANLALARRTRWLQRIDPVRARTLRDQGWGLVEIGKIMAEEIGRVMPYRYDSIYRAITRREQRK